LKKSHEKCHHCRGSRSLTSRGFDAATIQLEEVVGPVVRNPDAHFRCVAVRSREYDGMHTQLASQSPDTLPPDLQKIINAWHSLTPEIVAAVLAIIESAIPRGFRHEQ